MNQEMFRMAARREATRMGTSRKATRMSTSWEAGHMAASREPVRSRHRRVVAGHRQPREPHNLAHRMRRESQPFRQIRK